MSTVLVAVIIISFIAAIVLVLVAINNRDRKQTTLELLSRFSDRAMESNLSFSSQELLENTLMGLDGIQRKLLVIKKFRADKYESLLIDLNEVKRCRKIQVYNSVSVGDGKKENIQNQLEKIVLEFEYLDGRTPTEIVFFEPLNNHILTMSELSEKAKKWEGIISKLLPGELKKTG